MPRRRYSRGYARSRRRYGSRGGSLTGGTGDVNPQWFNLDTAVTATDANPIVAAGTSSEFVVPLQQQALMSSKGNKSMVMELLKVDFYLSGTVGSTNGNLRAALASRSPSTSGSDLFPTKPHVLAGVAFTAVECTGGSTTTGTAYACIRSVNLTDEAGHGVIFAGQKMFLALEKDAFAGSNTTPGAQSIRARVLFRWKNVSLTEYIGVVTSQLAA